MNAHDFDLVIVGAGSGGLTAATFAAQLGAKVALVEKNRIGGDCTWTGCVPSKALLKVAKVAHDVRTAGRFGIVASPPVTDMTKVREYVREAIRQVYRFETADHLRNQGIEVIEGTGQFVDAHTLRAGEQMIRAKTFLLTTGARPRIPNMAGLHDVPFVTYEQIFENGRLPRRMIVIGGGPIGLELSQAYRRLGSEVIVVAEHLLPKDEPEASELMRRVLESEGVRFASGRADSAHNYGDEIVVASGDKELSGDMLLIACGREPCVAGLDLEKAGVEYSARGIAVDDRLRTNVKNIYAAGDVTGGYQFTHFAGWQAFQAARNALLPGGSSGFADTVPWVTFTEPEVAHAGLTEEQARAKFGDDVIIRRWEIDRTDRAVCEDDREGFLKVVMRRDGTIAGATAVNRRAGEMVAELMVAMKQKMRLSDLAGIIHPYPTYSTAIQQLSAELAIEQSLSGSSGKIIRGLSRIIR